MQITKAILVDIENHLQTGVSVRELAESIGVGSSSVQRWRNGKTQNINNKVWPKLNEILSGDNTQMPASAGASRMKIAETYEVSIVTLKGMGNHAPAVESLTDFLRGHEKRLWTKVKDGQFLVRYDDGGLEVVLTIDPVIPANGGAALVLLHSESIPLVARFARVGASVTLTVGGVERVEETRNIAWSYAITKALKEMQI